jgi:thioredoxin-related protein
MTKWINILLLTCVTLHAAAAVSTDTLPGVHLSGRQQYFVVVFLSPECPLSQNYTSVLNKLSDSYNEQIAFYGIIPGKSYTAEDMEKFHEEYHIGFTLARDTLFRLTRKLKATTTPEAFLLDGRGSILYEGLIDNWAVSLGVQRTVTTEHYLQAAIDASLHHLPIAIRQTRPVGCLINTK